MDAIPIQTPEAGRLDRTDDAPIDNRPSVGALFTKLVDDGRALAGAEFALYRAEAIKRIASVGASAVLILVAAVLAQGALIAMLLGLMFILAQRWGMVDSVAIVAGGSLAIAGVLAWLGIKRLTALMEPAEPHEAELSDGGISA